MRVGTIYSLIPYFTEAHFIWVGIQYYRCGVPRTINKNLTNKCANILYKFQEKIGQLQLQRRQALEFAGSKALFEDSAYGVKGMGE